MNKSEPRHIKLDSHLHFYDSWNISLDQLLTVAHTNLTLEQADNTILPAICLLDTGRETSPIHQQLNSPETDEWQTESIENEPYTFWCKNHEKTLLVITGTQINTAEGLEVLVVGEQGDAAQGMPIKTLLEQQNDARLNIIPWAAGKWLSKRGQLLSQLLETRKPQQFILGDNAGRPWLWKNIDQLAYARVHNIPILCGSDPLPLPKHYLKSGSYGNLIETSLDPEKPWKSIIQAIHKQPQAEAFGHLSSVPSFIINQLKLRL